MCDPGVSHTRYPVGAAHTEVHFSVGTVNEALREYYRDERRALLVADTNTAPLCTAYEGPKVVLQPGETAKQWASVSAILDAALAAGITRDGRIIAVGGGVICDLAAFAASIYLRGVSCTLVPTTLLAMVDAAFGGKTGMNYGGLKNMVGTFYPADMLIIAPQSLETLSNREYQSGLAEVIKSAMVGDQDLFDFLPQAYGRVAAREMEAVRIIVERSLAVKAAVVERDFTETGVRASLNLGHTFGHALESVAGFGSWTHGEAVAWGIVCALDLGVQMKLTDPGYAEEAVALIESYGFPTHAPGISVEALLEAMQHDKKVKAGTMRFVLQRRLGATETVAASLDALIEVLTSRTAG